MSGSSKTSSLAECDDDECHATSAQWVWNGSSWVELNQCPSRCIQESQPDFDGSFVGEEYLVPCGCP
jgi:hypothetical protein